MLCHLYQSSQREQNVAVIIVRSVPAIDLLWSRSCTSFGLKPKQGSTQPSSMQCEENWDLPNKQVISIADKLQLPYGGDYWQVGPIV